MFDLNKNSIISFNPQYYTTSHKKTPEKYNIYLGGSKIKPKFQKSIRKGISLSKSLSYQKQLSNLNYFKQTIKKPQQNIFYNVTPLSQSLKPKILINHSQCQFYNVNSLKRSQSSPFILNQHIRTPQRRMENSLSKVKIINNIQNIENSQFYRRPIKPQVTITKLNSHQPETQFTGNFHVNQQRNVSPVINAVQKQNLTKKYNNQLKCKFSNIMSSSQKTFIINQPINRTCQNHQKVYVNPFVTQKSTNKTIRPITFKSPLKPSVNFNSLIQQKNNRLYSEVINSQNQPTYRILEPTLKQSISTAQGRSSQQIQNHSVKSLQIIQNPQNTKTQFSKKTQKYSVKSLWDSVEKCTVSLICENYQLQSLQDKHSAFNRKVQPTYNELSQFSSLDELVFENNSADNKKSTFPISQYSPIRNL